MTRSTIREAIDAAAWRLAEQREAALRDAARERLPRPLRWAVDHPRALRVIYRLRPGWKPVVVIGADGGMLSIVVQRLDGTVHIFEVMGIR